MTKFKEFLKDMNDLKMRQQTHYWLEDLPSDLHRHFDDNNTYEKLDNELDVSKHRWYETSITVFGIYGKICGVRIVSDTKGNQDVEDCYNTLEFFEMKEVQTVTYEKK